MTRSSYPTRNRSLFFSRARRERKSGRTFSSRKTGKCYTTSSRGWPHHWLNSPSSCVILFFFLRLLLSPLLPTLCSKARLLEEVVGPTAGRMKEHAGSYARVWLQLLWCLVARRATSTSASFFPACICIHPCDVLVVYMAVFVCHGRTPYRLRTHVPASGLSLDLSSGGGIRFRRIPGPVGCTAFLALCSDFGVLEYLSHKKGDWLYTFSLDLARAHPTMSSQLSCYRYYYRCAQRCSIFGSLDIISVSPFGGCRRAKTNAQKQPIVFRPCL